MNTNRPFEITMLGILLLALGILRLLSDAVRLFSTDTTFELSKLRWLTLNPDSQVILLFLGSLAVIISGMYLMKGYNLGRYIAVSWYTLELLLYEDQLIVRIAIVVVVAAVLFNPRAQRYFTSE